MAESTFYEVAQKEMQRLIGIYLELAAATAAFTNVRSIDVQSEDARRVLLAGIGSSLDPGRTSAGEAIAEWSRMKAVTFETEPSITTGVYFHLRPYGRHFLDQIEADTNGFEKCSPEYVSANPHFLPIFQHLAGIFSKAQLKQRIGSASDHLISPTAAERLANVFNDRQLKGRVNKGEILQRLESTLEGLVRDLVGKVLLEGLVATALASRSLPFQREKEYRYLSGVVYDFRADFVLPSAANPQAFIEVRKSSSRHASLYAKDKMFSAINWKGNNKSLLGVLLVEGPWTSATLQVMARIFDYVMPVTRASEVAEVLQAYLAGDTSKLRWIIEFRISAAY